MKRRLQRALRTGVVGLSVMLASAQPEFGLQQGQIIQLALTPGDVTIAEELDTFLTGFSPQGFRADDVSPPWLVDKDTDKYREFGLNNIFQRVNVEGSMRGKVRQVDPESGLKDYSVIERSLGSYIPKTTAAQSNYDLKLVSSQRVQEALALDREWRLWTLLRLLGSWNANNRTTLVAPWSDKLNSDPIKDLQDRIIASAQEVTDIWMSPLGAFTFLGHPAARDHMRQMLGDNPPSPGAVKASGSTRLMDFQIPGMPPIHVAPAKELNEATGNLDYLLDNDVVLTCRPGAGVPRTGQEIQTVQTFRRRGESGTGVTTREYPVEDQGLEGGTMLVAGHAEDVKMISDVCGGLIKGVA